MKDLRERPGSQRPDHRQWAVEHAVCCATTPTDVDRKRAVPKRRFTRQGHRQSPRIEFTPSPYRPTSLGSTTPQSRLAEPPRAAPRMPGGGGLLAPPRHQFCPRSICPRRSVHRPCLGRIRQCVGRPQHRNGESMGAPFLVFSIVGQSRQTRRSSRPRTTGFGVLGWPSRLGVLPVRPVEPHRGAPLLNLASVQTAAMTGRETIIPTPCVGGDPQDTDPQRRPLRRHPPLCGSVSRAADSGPSSVLEDILRRAARRAATGPRWQSSIHQGTRL